MRDPISPTRRSRGGGLSLVAALLCAVACQQPSNPRPSVLWIVWDTVRADHLSLYGYERDTTPFLNEWSRSARVFDDCLSTAGYTLPSHASMFTGLLPSEHCTDNLSQRLDDAHTTIAERLQAAGYQTFLYSANPHISRSGNFHQGFDASAHPWDPRYFKRALHGVRARLSEGDRTSELGDEIRDALGGDAALTSWNLKDSGELAQEAALEWLASIEPGRPFFVFLNYMEAHQPTIPPRAARRRFMSDGEVERSFQVDRSWRAIWEYTFGLREFDAEEVALTRATYDATLLVLDGLLRGLIEALGSAGHLEDTVVILTSDHGEHLGEHHMLDHQYSVFQPLLRVPLVVHAPGHFRPGRDARPVMNFDLFPTILELAGVETGGAPGSRARSLIGPAPERTRFAEDTSSAALGVDIVKTHHPQWDPSPWQRRLRALVRGETKYIWGSDGRHALFDLRADPEEARNLFAARRETARRFERELDETVASLSRCERSNLPVGSMSPEQLQLLRSLGYAE